MAVLTRVFERPKSATLVVPCSSRRRFSAWSHPDVHVAGAGVSRRGGHIYGLGIYGEIWGDVWRSGESVYGESVRTFMSRWTTRIPWRKAIAREASRRASTRRRHGSGGDDDDEEEEAEEAAASRRPRTEPAMSSVTTLRGSTTEAPRKRQSFGWWLTCAGGGETSGGVGSGGEVEMR